MTFYKWQGCGSFLFVLASCDFLSYYHNYYYCYFHVISITELKVKVIVIKGCLVSMPVSAKISVSSSPKAKGDNFQSYLTYRILLGEVLSSIIITYWDNYIHFK